MATSTYAPIATSTSAAVVRARIAAARPAGGSTRSIAGVSITGRGRNCLAEKKEWTQEELVRAVHDFHQAVLYIDHNRGVWEGIVKECERAFCDVRHYCELFYPTNPAKRTDVCQLLRDYGHRRRKYKDLLNVTEPMWRIKEQLYNAGLYREANKMDKLHESTKEGNRSYVPRELPDLFKEEEEEDIW